jgi:ferredoxin
VRFLPALRIRLPAQGHPHHPGRDSARRPAAHVEKAPQEFEIDMLRCIYCGMCQEVCPEEAIWLQTQYSMTGYTREEMVNNKARLYELGRHAAGRPFQVGPEEGRRRRRATRATERSGGLRWATYSSTSSCCSRWAARPVSC